MRHARDTLVAVGLMGAEEGENPSSKELEIRRGCTVCGNRTALRALVLDQGVAEMKEELEALGWTVEEAHLGMCDGSQLTQYEACLRQGCYDLLVASGAGGSWSMARAPALRSKEKPKGRPGLPKTQQAQVETENRQVQALLRCAWAADGGGAAELLAVEVII